MKPLVNKPLREIVAELRTIDGIHGIHVGRDGMYTIAIDNQLIVLTARELRWFGLGILFNKSNDIKEE